MLHSYMNSSYQKRKNIYAKVLSKITPNKVDIIAEEKIVKEITEKINKIEGNHSHVEWCGSSARGTHLKGDRDIDLFLMFDEKMSENELEKEGLKIGKNVFRGHKWEKAYSQHPYIRGNIKGFDIEIVPSFIVKKGSNKKSAVDRTPFHNKYLIKNQTKKQKQDARLLKQFLKGIDAYGADLKNNSLPGYGVELLILYYKNFENTLKAISKWKNETKIKFNNKKTNVDLLGPLIIIDPVDENRNVASALNKEQYQRIIYAAKEFLRAPSIKFFFKKKIKPWNKEKVKKMLSKKELMIIKSSFPKKYLEDIVWGQIRRISKKINTYIEINDFKVTRNCVYYDKESIYFILELESIEIQKAKILIGPKSSDAENVEKFLKNKKEILSGPRIENERIVIEIERKENNAFELIKNFIKENKKTSKNATKSIFSKAIVLDEKEILRNYKGEFKNILTKHLSGKEVFE